MLHRYPTDPLSYPALASKAPRYPCHVSPPRISVALHSVLPPQLLHNQTRWSLSCGVYRRLSILVSGCRNSSLALYRSFLSPCMVHPLWLPASAAHCHTHYPVISLSGALASGLNVGINQPTNRQGNDKPPSDVNNQASVPAVRETCDCLPRLPHAPGTNESCSRECERSALPTPLA